MSTVTLPDPDEREPTLSTEQLKLFLRPECCISFAVQAAIRELIERREAPHCFGEERCADCGGQLELVCPSYVDQGSCFKNLHS